MSDTHRQGIACTLRVLDELLSLFERWLRDPPANGPLYRETQQVSNAARQAIETEISALRHILAEMRDDLTLEPRSQAIAAAIWARAMVFWEALVDLEPTRLRRYGDLPEGVADYLKPRVKALQQHLMRLTELAGRAK